MPRILRNYLISFVIIGLFLLIVHLINRYVEQRSEEAPPAPPSREQSTGTVPPAQPARPA